MKARLSGSETQPVAPATSEVPMAEPPPFCRVVVPHPEAASGGVENIPEELLAPGEQF